MARRGRPAGTRPTVFRRRRGHRRRLSHSSHRGSVTGRPQRVRRTRRSTDVVQAGQVQAAMGAVVHRRSRERQSRDRHEDAPRDRRRRFRCRNQ